VFKEVVMQVGLPTHCHQIHLEFVQQIQSLLGMFIVFRSRVVLHKLVVVQLVKKFHAIYGAQVVTTQNPPLDPILNQLNSVHNPMSYIFNIRVNI
jgi:hypothetical protein